MVAPRAKGYYTCVMDLAVELCDIGVASLKIKSAGDRNVAQVGNPAEFVGYFTLSA